MTLFDSPSFEGHEGVHAFHDEKTGLKAIIAVHSTARGPAASLNRYAATSPEIPPPTTQ